MENYSHPRVQAHYDATVDGGQVRQILKNPSVPTGLIRATGSLQYRPVANRSLLDTLVLKGDLKSRQLDVETPALRTQINSIVAHYSVDDGNAILQELRANLLGGELTATGTMSSIAGDSHSKLKASLRGVSLAEVKRVLGGSSVPENITLGGVLNAEANASWGKTIDDLVAQTDATINGLITNTSSTAKRDSGRKRHTRNLLC